MAFSFCTDDALLEFKPDGDVSTVTGATKSLFGLDSSRIVGEKFAFFALLEGLVFDFRADENGSLGATLQWLSSAISPT